MTDRAALARPLAAVTTATVDVQVLRIGAKQMTLAVFRQLERDDEPRGPMWGTVNYHHRSFGWRCQENDHRHVVWQDGEALRHAVLVGPDRFEERRIRILRKLQHQARHHGRFTDRDMELLGRHPFFWLEKWDIRTGDDWWYVLPQKDCEELAEAIELARRLLPPGQTEQAEHDRAAACWRASANIPQLFIAV